MFFEPGGDIPFARFIAPRVEVELAFVLGRTLKGPGVTLCDVLAAADWVVPAVEIIDARIEQKDRDTQAMRTVRDTIADNAANAGIVMGGRPVRPDAVDLRWVSALLQRNGVIEESGVAAAVLNHPATGVAWLANRLAQWDEQLDAGQVVLAGSFTRPVRSEEHTSELQSPCNLVCRLLLAKKNKQLWALAQRMATESTNPVRQSVAKAFNKVD